MSIRKRLAIISVLPLVVALLGSIYIIRMNGLQDYHRNELQFITTVSNDIFDLNFLSDRYLLYREKQVRAQWLLKHNTLGKMLAGQHMPDMENDKLWHKLGRIHRDMGRIFFQLSGTLDSGGASGDVTQLDDREERLTMVLLLKAREMFSTAERIAGAKQHELVVIRQKLNYSIIVLFVMFALVISIISALSSRAIIASIGGLRRGTEIVASGNLDHRLEPRGDDELGQLAKAFNVMTERVKSADTNLRNTISALRQEVEDRKRAEENARDLNQQLETAVAALEEEIAEHQQTGDELRSKEHLLVLQSRQASMGEMIGNIAHQWRQPLNLLAIIVQSLPMKGERGDLCVEDLRSCSEKSMQIISHMSQTIDDFRNFFRPDKEKVPFKVCDAVSRAVSIIEGSFAGSRIKLETHVSGDPVVNGYPNEFSQVLINILLNARDVLVERRVDNPLVTITIDGKAGKSAIAIADNGGGIPEDIMDKIFDPYFTTRGPDRGTGVGLFMSKTIIEKNMNGALTARNVGAGAEFRIEV